MDSQQEGAGGADANDDDDADTSADEEDDAIDNEDVYLYLYIYINRCVHDNSSLLMLSIETCPFSLMPVGHDAGGAPAVLGGGGAPALVTPTRFSSLCFKFHNACGLHCSRRRNLLMTFMLLTLMILFSTVMRVMMGLVVISWTCREMRCILMMMMQIPALMGKMTPSIIKMYIYIYIYIYIYFIYKYPGRCVHDNSILLMLNIETCPFHSCLLAAARCGIFL